MVGAERPISGSTCSGFGSCVFVSVSSCAATATTRNIQMTLHRRCRPGHPSAGRERDSRSGEVADSGCASPPPVGRFRGRPGLGSSAAAAGAMPDNRAGMYRQPPRSVRGALATFAALSLLVPTPRSQAQRDGDSRFGDRARPGRVGLAARFRMPRSRFGPANPAHVESRRSGRMASACSWRQCRSTPGRSCGLRRRASRSVPAGSRMASSSNFVQHPGRRRSLHVRAGRGRGAAPRHPARRKSAQRAASLPLPAWRGRRRPGAAPAGERRRALRA